MRDILFTGMPEKAPRAVQQSLYAVRRNLHVPTSVALGTFFALITYYNVKRFENEKVVLKVKE